MSVNSIELLVKDSLAKMKEKKYLNYLVQFDEFSENESNVLKKWLEYKYKLDMDKYAGVDLDVSMMAVISYCKELMEYNKTSYGELLNDIRAQEGEKRKYEIILEDSLAMRGDWLTSPLYIIKLYMRYLWEKEKDSKSKEEYIKLFSRNNNNYFLSVPEDWKKYCYKHTEIIWEAFDDAVKKFLRNTVHAGNFIMMPIYVNPCRCKVSDDTLDALLWKMYCCFTLKGDELNKFLERSFKGNNEKKARDNVRRWMNVFNNSWDEFVKYNFLEAAISRDGEKYGKPLDLRTGEVINLDAGEDYDPMPADIGACEAMMENYNTIIEKRTDRIFECITK